MIPALLGLLLLQPADTDPAPPVAAPRGTPPQVLTVKVSGDQIVAQRTVNEMVPVTREDTVVVNGRQVKRVYTAYETRTKTVSQTWSLKGATAQRADGTKITPADLKKLLASPRAIVLSGDGRPVDKGYLALLKKDTVVLVATPAAPAGGPVPAPPPVPVPRAND